MTKRAKFLITLFSIAAISSRGQKEAKAQIDQAHFNIYDRVVSCGIGSIHTYDADFSPSAYSVQGFSLELTALNAATDENLRLRHLVCDNVPAPPMEKEIQNALGRRLGAVNSCVLKEEMTLKDNNIEATTAITKIENKNLKAINEILVFSRGLEEFSSRATETAKESYEYLSAVGEFGSAVKEMAALAGAIKIGGTGARHMATEIIKHKATDKAKELGIDEINPFAVAGSVEKSYLLKRFSDEMSIMDSFSYSECQ